jgi:hypothetical protein
MNKQIQQLAEQAGLYVDLNGAPWPRAMSAEACEAAYKKFVQLIVRECLRELQYTVLDTQELRRDKSTDYQVGWEDGMFDAGEMIKQHFGVNP